MLSSVQKIEILCGQHRVQIRCGRFEYKDALDDARLCNKNTLVFIDGNGVEYVLRQPNNFRQDFVVDKTPVSMACARGKDGSHYLTIEFSADPAGADSAQGTVFDLFESDGSRITINGRFYDSKMNELGIPYTDTLKLCGTKYTKNCKGDIK